MALERRRYPPSHFDVHGTTVFALTRAHQALRRLMAPGLTTLGLYEGRDLVVLEIARQGPWATAGRIRQALDMTGGSLSTVLRRSVHAEYVTRKRHPEDRRSWVLGLTPTGRICTEMVAETWRAADATALEGLSAMERRELRRLLRLVTAAMRSGERS